MPAASRNGSRAEGIDPLPGALVQEPLQAQHPHARRPGVLGATGGERGACGGEHQRPLRTDLGHGPRQRPVAAGDVGEAVTLRGAQRGLEVGRVGVERGGDRKSHRTPLRPGQGGRWRPLLVPLVMSLPIVPTHDPVAHPERRERPLGRGGDRAGAGDPRAGPGAGRGHPGPQLPAARGPAGGRPRGRLAAAGHRPARRCRSRPSSSAASTSWRSRPRCWRRRSACSCPTSRPAARWPTPSPPSRSRTGRPATPITRW